MTIADSSNMFRFSGRIFWAKNWSFLWNKAQSYRFFQQLNTSTALLWCGHDVLQCTFYLECQCTCIITTCAHHDMISPRYHHDIMMTSLYHHIMISSWFHHDNHDIMMMSWLWHKQLTNRRMTSLSYQGVTGSWLQQPDFRLFFNLVVSQQSEVLH